MQLHDINFLFLIAAFFAFIALQLLMYIKEKGEVEKEKVKCIMLAGIHNNLKEYFLIGYLIGLHEQLWTILKKKLVIDNEDKNPQAK